MSPMKAMVTLSKKRQSRLIMLNGIEIDRITARKAVEVLGLSPYNIKITLAVCRGKSTTTLAQGNRGGNLILT